MLESFLLQNLLGVLNYLRNLDEDQRIAGGKLPQ